MCDVSGKLIAWMDGELPEIETAAIARHVESCAECRECLNAFEQTSNAFNAYCQMAAEQAEGRPLTANVSRQKVPDEKTSRWMPVAIGVGAIAAAAVVAFLVIQPHSRTVQAPPSTAVPSVSAHVVANPNRGGANNSVAPRITVVRHRRSQSQAPKTLVAQSILPKPQQTVDSPDAAAFAVQPPIEISVPAEDMFPPGAVPDGISYNAIVTFAAESASQRFGNGSASGVKAGFDREGNHP
jgi:hypothetical protein